jgi:hypothetical protein
MKGRDELKERKKEEPCRVLAVDNIFDMSTPSDTNDIITRKRLHSNGRAESFFQNSKLKLDAE